MTKEEKQLQQTQEEELVVFDGVGEIDEELKEFKKEEISQELSKKKKEALENITVKVSSIPFNGNDVSQNRMGNMGVLANWIFNKSIGSTLRQVAEAPETDDVTKAMLAGLADIFDGIYKAVYKDNKLGWKGADDKIHMVQAESVLEALMKTMKEVGKTISEIEKEKMNKMQEIGQETTAKEEKW
jgi:hypothetical protein